MKKFEIVCIVEEYNSIDEIPVQYKTLIIAANEALTSAYAPYSNFQVGAALLVDDDCIVKGSNQENAAYPSGLCAERVAFFSAGSQYPGKEIKAIAITTSFPLENPIAPCGACRQVMAEYELKQKSPIKIILSHNGGNIYILNSMMDLLPLYFSGEWLKIGRIVG